MTIHNGILVERAVSELYQVCNIGANILEIPMEYEELC